MGEKLRLQCLHRVPVGWVESGGFPLSTQHVFLLIELQAKLHKLIE
jgi:hypothetical protein